MKKITAILFSLMFLAVIGFFQGCAGEKADKPVDMDNLNAKASYILGSNYGQRLKNIAEDIDMDALYLGLKETIQGKEPRFNQEESKKIFDEFQKIVSKKQQEKNKVLGEKNKTEGDAFLKENATKEGVKTTASGLQYIVMKEGEGEFPKATDTVEVHYKGTLLDGTQFDSSYDRGKAAKFPLNRVIKGWTEGLQLMKPGSKYKFFIPSEIGYGSRGNQRIPPNSVLTFVVELIAVNPPAEAPKKPAPNAKKADPHAGHNH